METLRPLVLLFVLVLMLNESFTQEQQQVLLMQADVPDNTDVIRDRRSPQFEGLFGPSGGRRGHHGYAGSHIKKQTTTYGIGPFYASYSTSHANSHANSHAGHAHGPHYGHGYNDHYGYRPYKPYHGGYNGGYHGGYHGGNHGHHGGGGGGGLFTSFLDF